MVVGVGRTAGELIAVIRDAAAELCAVDVSQLHPRDLLRLTQEASQASSVVDAARTGLVGSIDEVGAAGFDGFRATKPWLRHKAGASAATAGRTCKRARALSRMPIVRQRYESGRLSTDQVDAFVRVLNPRTEERMAADELMLADLAEGLDADDTARKLRAWSEYADADGAAPDPGHTSRGFTMSQGFDRSWTGSFTLGSANGALLDAAVARAAHQMFLDDQRTGNQRSATQRRADALMALVLGDATPKTTINLVIDAADLEAGVLSSRTTAGAEAAGMTGDGSNGASAAISAADTLRLAQNASVRPIVIDPNGGAVLHYGESRRLASPLQRAALAIESADACAFPGCTNGIDVAHHIQEWSSARGRPGKGPTDLPNLVGLCFEHHDLVHDERWRVHKARDGTISWSRPDGSAVDPRPGWPRQRSRPARRRRVDRLADRRTRARLDELNRRVGRPPAA